MKNLIMPIVVSCLATYGWLLIVWLAKRREIYDLFRDTISHFEKLEEDWERAWRDGRMSPDGVDSNILHRCSEEQAMGEIRIDLIQQHYQGLKDPKTQKTLLEYQTKLRQSFSGKNEEGVIWTAEKRRDSIQKNVIGLNKKLIRENYNHINKCPWFIPRRFYRYIF